MLRILLGFTVVLRRGVAGNVLGVAAVLRDVTARWERELVANCSAEMNHKQKDL